MSLKAAGRENDWDVWVYPPRVDADPLADAGASPVERQLLYSILAYMAGARFEPAVEINPAGVRGNFAEPASLAEVGVLPAE